MAGTLTWSGGCHSGKEAGSRQIADRSSARNEYGSGQNRLEASTRKIAIARIVSIGVLVGGLLSIVAAYLQQSTCSTAQACLSSYEDSIAIQFRIGFTALLSGLALVVLTFSARSARADSSMAIELHPGGGGSTAAPDKEMLLLDELRRTVDAERSALEGLSTRAAVVLGFIAVLIPLAFSTLAASGNAQSAWVEIGVATLGVSAAVLFWILVRKPGAFGESSQRQPSVPRENDYTPGSLIERNRELATVGHDVVNELSSLLNLGTGLLCIGVLFFGIGYFLR